MLLLHDCVDKFDIYAHSCPMSCTRTRRIILASSRDEIFALIYGVYAVYSLEVAQTLAQRTQQTQKKMPLLLILRFQIQVCF